MEEVISVLKGYIVGIAKTRDWTETDLLKNLSVDEAKEMSNIFSLFVESGGMESNLNLNLPILRRVFDILIDASPGGASRRIRNVIPMGNKAYKKPNLSDIKDIIDIHAFVEYSNKTLPGLIKGISHLRIDVELEACYLLSKSWAEISLDFYSRDPKAVIRNSKINNLGITKESK